MASPAERLAASLEELQRVQQGGVVRSSSLGRAHRERLLRNDFLLEVVKGWYLVTRPGVKDGSSTPWFASYWAFISAYLTDRFGEDYCLSSESSLHLHTGATVVPAQLVVIAKAKGAHKLQLNLGQNNSTCAVHCGGDGSDDFSHHWRVTVSVG